MFSDDLSQLTVSEKDSFSRLWNKAVNAIRRRTVYVGRGLIITRQDYSGMTIELAGASSLGNSAPVIESFPFQVIKDPSGSGESGYRQLIMRSGLCSNFSVPDTGFTAPENTTSYLWLFATISGFNVQSVVVENSDSPTGLGWSFYPDIGTTLTAGNIHKRRYVLIATITTGPDEPDPSVSIIQHVKSAVFLPMPETVSVAGISTTQAVDINVFVSGLSIMQGKKTLTFVDGRLTAISSQSDSTIVTGGTCT